MRWIGCALAALLTAAVPLPGHAERWAAPQGGFTLELPEGTGWSPMEMPPEAVKSLPPKATLVARRTEAGRAAILTVVPGVPMTELQDEVIIGFEKGLYAQNPSAKVSGARATVQGEPAYRYLGRLPNGAWTGGYVAIKDHVMYNIQAVKADGDPFLDKDLNAYLESFHWQ